MQERDRQRPLAESLQAEDFGGQMKRLDLSFPQFLFIIGTRVLLAAGVGLLISEKLRGNNRRRVGLTLVTLGALTTLPSVIFVRKSFEKERAKLIA
jgi:hypothetical protein